MKQSPLRSTISFSEAPSQVEPYFRLDYRQLFMLVFSRRNNGIGIIEKCWEAR
jgi:hypothetical protein